MTTEPFGNLPPLEPVDDELLDALVGQVMFAADDAVLHPAASWRTQAELTRLAVKAAIANGIQNGALTLRPQEQWREWWSMTARPEDR